MNPIIDNLEPTNADIAAAERWANRLPDAAPGVHHDTAINITPPTMELGDFDDSEFIKSLKDKSKSALFSARVFPFAFPVCDIHTGFFIKNSKM